ncbi:MAG: hypothetical protein GWN76_03960 [candidate division Zixibacteria bacterium]|nr:hypothetical protein [Phycisphaerae bacterium]NIR63068.1 hypothetical protein [candidate division Zixibacteria bacterium]NIU13187.1 hypothetical protein [candidate division Zixibacteria bacterium]NIW43992.1 hypothetical protein [Gammaproteobacteria bacterium]NIW99462.1 hypothetical protein [Phycisphaerae bacterium]
MDRKKLDEIRDKIVDHRAYILAEELDIYHIRSAIDVIEDAIEHLSECGAVVDFITLKSLIDAAMVYVELEEMADSVQAVRVTIDSARNTEKHIETVARRLSDKQQEFVRHALSMINGNDE